MHQDSRCHELAGVCTNLFRIRESVWCDVTCEGLAVVRVAETCRW